MVATYRDTHLEGEVFDDRVMPVFLQFFQWKYSRDMPKDMHAAQKYKGRRCRVVGATDGDTHLGGEVIDERVTALFMQILLKEAEQGHGQGHARRPLWLPMTRQRLRL